MAIVVITVVDIDICVVDTVVKNYNTEFIVMLGKTAEATVINIHRG